MLVISRRSNQSVHVGDDIEIRILGAKNDSVRLGIVAPNRIPVVRGELLEKVKQQNLASLALDAGILQKHSQSFGSKRNKVEVPLLSGYGDVARWASHQIRNLLTPVHGELQLSLLDCPEGELKESLETAESNVREMKAWSRSLGFLGRGSLVKGVTKPLKDGLEVACQLLKDDCGDATVSVNCMVDDEFRATTPGWEFPLSHLFHNSVEAQATRIDVRAAWANERLIVTVEDDGNGIDRSTLSRLGNPFVTTKGRHRGLGICYVRNWLETFKAQLFIESAPGRGTTVRMTFPAVVDDPVEEKGMLILRGEFHGARHKSLEKEGWRVLLAENLDEFEALKRAYPKLRIVEE